MKEIKRTSRSKGKLEPMRKPATSEEKSLELSPSARLSGGLHIGKNSRDLPRPCQRRNSLHVWTAEGLRGNPSGLNIVMDCQRRDG